ncbi:MAG: efflux RND transporter permease subunit [Pirellulales bacterium]
MPHAAQIGRAAAAPAPPQPLFDPQGTVHPSPPFAARIADLLIARRGLLAVLAVILAVASVERSQHLQFSRSIDTMFDRRDPALPPYARMTRTFGSNEVVLAAYDDPELFTPAGIARLRNLAAELETLPGVASATSLASTPLGDRIIDLDNGLTSGWARRLVSLLEGYVVGADHRTAAIACVLEPAVTTATQRAQAVSRAGTIDRLRARMRDLPQGTVAGEPAMLRDGFAMLERDGNLLGTGSGILAGAVLLACFRSLRWLVVPLVVVLLALWTTRGLLAVAGLRLTMVSTMLSAMVTVVGIATVTHLIVEYRRQRALGREPAEALRESITLLFWPIAGAIATDVIGFGSLVASDVGPVHDFGIMTALGAAMVLVAAAITVPFLALAGRFDADPRMAWGEGTLEAGLDRLVKRIIRHPLPILAASAAIAVACMVGMRWLTVETDFTKNFRDSSPTVAAYDMVEARLGGAGVWDVLVPATEPIDAAQLDDLDHLATRLRREVAAPGPDGGTAPALTKVMSVADVISAAPLLPRRLQALAVNAMLRQEGERQPAFVRALVGRDGRDESTWLRIMLRARERQPAATKRAIIAEVRRIAAEEYPAGPDGRGAEVTGFFVLLSQLVDRLLADQWLTFLIAGVGIFLLLAVAFRSPLLAAVAIIPNGLPIFVVLGLLGWLGIRINMGTAMIAAVSMGLSVDSSIHYVTAFRRRLSEGSVATALATAHQTAGRAMIFATLALAIGFLALTTSGFMPTVSFGWLSCLTLLGGLLGNLVVLPVLLTLLAPRLARP